MNKILKYEDILKNIILNKNSNKNGLPFPGKEPQSSILSF